jgi:hypothetical protein
MQARAIVKFKSSSAIKVALVKLERKLSGMHRRALKEDEAKVPFFSCLKCSRFFCFTVSCAFFLSVHSHLSQPCPAVLEGSFSDAHHRGVRVCLLACVDRFSSLKTASLCRRTLSSTSCSHRRCFQQAFKRLFLAQSPQRGRSLRLWLACIPSQAPAMETPSS